MATVCGKPSKQAWSKSGVIHELILISKKPLWGWYANFHQMNGKFVKFQSDKPHVRV